MDIMDNILSHEQMKSLKGINKCEIIIVEENKKHNHLIKRHMKSHF
jgi:hypothetical protein